MIGLLHYLLAAETSIAPATTENNTVILWVVGALVLVAGYLYARLAKKQDESELRCVTENLGLKKRVDDLQSTINQMHIDHDKQSTAALIGVSTALDGLQQAVKQIGSSSGGYRKQP